MKISMATGETTLSTETPDAQQAPAAALHPGYFFPDAAAEERLGVNLLLAKLGAAMDNEELAGGRAPPEVLALVPLAAQALLCFRTTGAADLPAPDLADVNLLPLDRETIAHQLVQAHGLAPRPDPVLPRPAARLAEALAPLPDPAGALHWLLLHRLLPLLCDDATRASVRTARAPLFRRAPGSPVLPLEFGVALLSAAPFPQPSARHLALTYWLNIPTAQGVLTALRQADKAGAGGVSLLPRLERADLNRGEAGAVLVAHELHNRTPLWFYLWREKALLGAGGHLGPLGARLLAEGMIGLIAEVGEATIAYAAASDPPEGTLQAWQAALT